MILTGARQHATTKIDWDIDRYEVYRIDPEVQNKNQMVHVITSFLMLISSGISGNYTSNYV